MAKKPSDQKSCLFIGAMGSIATNSILEKVVQPVLDEFPILDLTPAEHFITRGPITEDLISALTLSDLVLASVTDTNENVLYELGIRHSTRKPTIHFVMKEDRIPWSLSNTGAIVVDLDEPGLNRARDELRSALEHFLSENAPKKRSRTAKRQIPQQVGSSDELAQRIDIIAKSISDLRLNSTAKYVEQLYRISRSLRDSKDTPVVVEKAVKQTLPILANFYETIGSGTAAQVIVSGAVAGLVSIGGWPTVAAYTLTLAVWQGKDVFKEALKHAFKRK